VSDVFSTLELKKSSCSECAASDKSLVSVAVSVSTTLLLCFYTTINMPQQSIPFWIGTNYGNSFKFNFLAFTLAAPRFFNLGE